MNYKASCIIPVFNELSSLNNLCSKLEETFKNKTIKHIFIDDGFADGSTIDY